MQNLDTNQTTTISADTKCRCACKIKKCDLAKQYYDRKECNCFCTNPTIWECDKRSQKKLNTTTCDCECKEKNPVITSGMTWDNETCAEVRSPTVSLENK